jgi:general secretion pathway protein G
MSKKGFTLIEILVAATIIVMLAAGAMTAYSSINKKSRDSRRLSDVEQMRSALEMYRADNGSYPIVASGAYIYASGSFNSTLSTALVTPGYLPKLPREPKQTNEYYYDSDATGSTYTLEVCTEALQTNQSCTSTLTCTGLSSYCTKNP